MAFLYLNLKFLKFIKNDLTFLEKEPLEEISNNKQLLAYKHEGFWHCMDTLRDKYLIEKILKKVEKKNTYCWRDRFHRKTFN